MVLAWLSVLGGLALLVLGGEGGAGVERHVVAQRDELPREARLLGVLAERLAALRLLHRTLRGGEDGVEVAVLGEQLGGALRADARHARHVVRRVADEREVVDQLGGRHAVLLAHRRLVEPHLLLVAVHADRRGARRAVVDELQQILVGRDDDDLLVVAGGARGGARGGDHVVGLEVGRRHVRHAERVASLVDRV